MSFLRFLLLFPLAMALLIGPSLIVACNKPAPSAPKITAPKQTPPVAPSAQKTVTQTGKVVESIDGANVYAEQVNDLDPAKKPLITGLTNARAEAVRAVEQATETHDLAVAKDAEAKASQGALVEAIKAVKELAASEAKARGERDKLQAHIDEHKDDLLGPKTHRILRGMFWTFIIVGSLIAVLGFVGSRYGLPEITKPAASIVGSIFNGVRWGLYRLGTIIWSGVPFVGHAIDEHLNGVAKLKAQTKQTKRQNELLSNAKQLPNLNAEANGPGNLAWTMPTGVA